MWSDWLVFWLWFHISVCPLMPSLTAYHLTWVSLTLDVGYLFTADPAKHSHCSLPWKLGISSQPPLLTLKVRHLLSATAPVLGHGVPPLGHSCAEQLPLLLSFVLIDIICQVNLLYFIFVGLFWFCLWVYMYMCIFSHTFYCCYKPLPLRWGSAVLWSFPFFLLSFLLKKFFLTYYYFFHIYFFVCFSYCSFPLAVNR